MTYSKPRLVPEGSAVKAVQTVQLQKGVPIQQDRNFPLQTAMTAGAYDADE
jgi:hypothetical protein